jgi:uncharacterized repeat protein (TIGR03803 family)
MTSKVEHRTYWKAISQIRLRAGTTALALASCLLAFGASAQAQTFTTLHSFDSTDGSDPVTGLVQGTDGNFYGTTVNGGANNEGTLFKMTLGGTLTTLHSFDGTDGEQPYAALIQANDGNFYGTTLEGGANGAGTVFNITPSGTLTTLYNFCSQSGCTDGEGPNGLVQAIDGSFYGTAYAGGANNNGTVFKITSSGTLTTLYAFCSQSGCTDGSTPYWGLVQATDGDFYGTTVEGGVNGQGTVFKITRSGTLTALYSFCSQSNCTDGGEPEAGLVQATDGNFYGTTSDFGGSNNGGTVFKITPSGALTTLYSFCSQSGCTDGASPAAALIQATDGNFYGTAADGPMTPYCPTDIYGYGCGTVFKITPGGTLTTLYSFCSQSGCTDGADPGAAALVQATNGSFYGTAFLGGANDTCDLNGFAGCGTVYSLSVGLRPFVETQTTSGRVGSVVKILGTDLTGATSVTFNGTAAAFTIESKSAIAATVPAGATSGEVEVVTSFGTLKSNVPFRVQP